MTTYTAIPNTDIDADSPVNVSLMTKMRDNPIAITEGSTGAPKIQTAAYDTASVDQAAIGAGAIHRGELDTGTEEEASNTNCATGTELVFTSPGGYGFWPEMRRVVSGTGYWKEDSSSGLIRTPDSSYGTTRMKVCHSVAGGTDNTFIRFRYITSSPPYDLGDGDVGRFVYAEVDPSGTTVRCWNADDPPWATKIVKGKQRHDRDTGKTYAWQPTAKFPGKWGECAGDKAKQDAYIAALKNTEWEWVELTMAKKLAPMAGRPIPFEGKAEQSNTIILADPPSDILHRIQEVMEVDLDLSPAALLMDGYLQFDNTPLARSGPPGVPIHGISWKKT